MSQSNLNNPNNVIILAFDILRNFLGSYVQEKIRQAYNTNDEWVKVLYQDTNVTITDLIDPNCFLKHSNLQKVFSIILQQWDYVFNKLCFNYVPVNLINCLTFNLEQLINNYNFSFREVYKIIDQGEYLLECLNLRTDDLVFLRSHSLCLLGIEEMTVQKNDMLKKDSNVEMSTFYELDNFGNVKLANNYTNMRGQALDNLFLKYK